MARGRAGLRRGRVEAESSATGHGFTDQPWHERWWPTVARLRAFREIDTLTAFSLHLEPGADWRRFFRGAGALVKFGLTPKLSQSGESPGKARSLRPGQCSPAACWSSRHGITAAYRDSARLWQTARPGSPITSSRSPSAPSSACTGQPFDALLRQAAQRHRRGLRARDDARRTGRAHLRQPPASRTTTHERSASRPSPACATLSTASPVTCSTSPPSRRAMASLSMLNRRRIEDDAAAYLVNRRSRREPLWPCLRSSRARALLRAGDRS